MEHTFFSDGNSKRISWIIQSDDTTDEQDRDHVDLYLDKVTNEQSKYIALHAGIFWCIGRFIIENEDTVNVMLDSKSMYKHLTEDNENSDEFIEKRTWYYKKLIEQRKLKIKYHLIESRDDLATILL
ncbi:hypothetical protein MnTg01_00195 [archaeon MnTg01]|nr:hypothetical protein MnTg01_00195 [archaeon MnTg01]